MKTKIFRSILAVGLACMLSVSAFAEDLTSQVKNNWTVTFTSAAKMESTFKNEEINDSIANMQPGDSVKFRIDLKNDNSAETEWYMKNTILQSLEDSNKAAGGGAYTYILTYTAPDGTSDTLYNSDTVGGESKAGEGLHQATNALKDYFKLGNLKNGQTGTVNLEIKLDGETQGNAYQETLAKLQMEFAVELTQNNTSTSGNNPNTPSNNTPSTPSSSSRSTNVVHTGDDTNLMPFIIAAGVSGVLFLLLALYGVRERKKEKKGEQ